MKNIRRLSSGLIFGCLFHLGIRCAHAQVHQEPSTTIRLQFPAEPGQRPFTFSGDALSYKVDYAAGILGTKIVKDIFWGISESICKAQSQGFSYNTEGYDPDGNWCDSIEVELVCHPKKRYRFPDNPLGTSDPSGDSDGHNNLRRWCEANFKQASLDKDGQFTIEVLGATSPREVCDCELWAFYSWVDSDGWRFKQYRPYYAGILE